MMIFDMVDVGHAVVLIGIAFLAGAAWITWGDLRNGE
jgi:hypothetical protein